MNIKEAIEQLVNNKNISKTDTSKIMYQIMNDEITPAQFGAFVTALRMKGETPEEIAGMVETMRTLSLRVTTKLPVIDTCGTGGDGKGWFNISAAVAFVVAGVGIPVAKHGNRSVSSKVGSADLIEKLGLSMDVDLNESLSSIENTNFSFLFAPNFHKSMKNVSHVRKDLKMRTIFNILGPLLSPVQCKKQIIKSIQQGINQYHPN